MQGRRYCRKMNIKIGSLSLVVSSHVTKALPDWFNSDLEFESSEEAKAGSVVDIREYGGHEVVVMRVWRSRTPDSQERPLGEVFFTNKGSPVEPDVVSVIRPI
jgi:hypothetical protein